MRILVLTPLFPPDVSAPAAYAKELVTRLGEEHDVVCLHYGQLPEKAGDTTLISIRKDVATVTRLIRFMQALWTHRHADAVLMMNGPSVEFPFVLIRPFLRARLVYVESDHEAVLRAGLMGRALNRLLATRANHVCTPAATLLDRPILHPLDHASHDTVSRFQHDFTAHTQHIITLCQT